jgi:hypothetical protein
MITPRTPTFLPLSWGRWGRSTLVNVVGIDHGHEGPREAGMNIASLLAMATPSSFLLLLHSWSSHGAIRHLHRGPLYLSI